MRRRRDAIVTALLVAASAAAPAYESDVHYGLTWWLASQAGFDAAQSHDLARGDERTDTGMLDAKHAIVWQLCIRRDETAGELTRELHFRSQNRVPAPPADRPVLSTAPFAAAALKAVIGEAGTEPRDRLIRFGRALHGWQDTFAHRGEPAGLPACPADWSWAHPRERNGPVSHDADLTHAFIDDCLEAARSSYEHLLAYRKALKLPLGTTRPWATLATRALAFCGAETKTAKADWFSAQKVPQATAIAANTNLPDGKRHFRNAPAIDLGETLPVDPTAHPAPYEAQNTGAARDPEIEKVVKKVVGDAATTAPLPADARDFLDAFFAAWLTTPVAQLPERMAPFFGATLLPTSAPIGILVRLRLADRGEAALPLSAAPAAESVVTATPADWRGLLVRPRGREQAVFAGSPDKDGNLVVAIAVLRHAPYDVLVVTAAREGGSFRIKSIAVVPFH